jgi:hypothetical protein
LNNGQIHEASVDENGVMIKGSKYVLKEDGSYDKSNLNNDQERILIPKIDGLI